MELSRPIARICRSRSSSPFPQGELARTLIDKIAANCGSTQPVESVLYDEIVGEIINIISFIVAVVWFERSILPPIRRGALGSSPNQLRSSNGAKAGEPFDPVSPDRLQLKQRRSNWGSELVGLPFRLDGYY